MNKISIFRNVQPLYRISIRNKSEPILNLERLEKETSSGLEVVDEEAQKREEEIERKRNKSRLRDYHRNVVHDKNPCPEPRMWYQGTLLHNRKMFGRYGTESSVDPRYCWPTKQEMLQKTEYEQIAFPYTIPEAIEEAKAQRLEKEEGIRARQEDIANKVKKLDKWKTDLKNKINQKETEAVQAKQRKERLIEEVRRHFGYTVDPKDEKFKEMLEKKEKEQKKASKEAKKKERETKMISALLSKKAEDSTQKTPKENITKAVGDSEQ